MVVAVRPHLCWVYQLCLAVCCVLAYAVGTAAQAQKAVLEGTVQDVSGGVIASAEVEVRELETNQRRTALTDAQGVFRVTDVPVGTGRNSSRLPASATLDLRILKYFNFKPHGKLDLVIEAFNLLNRTNVIQVNTVYGPLLTPLRSFGRPIDAGAARQFQLSVDFEF